MRFRNKRRRVVLTILAGVLVAGLDGAWLNRDALKTAALSAIYESAGNRYHNVSCRELPTREEVVAIVSAHSDVVRRIENVNPGFVRFSVSSQPSCSEKADILIDFASKQDSEEIQLIIGDTFFGVPYRMTNV